MSHNIFLKRQLSSEQLSIVQSELEKKQKNKVVMYLLWWFLGIFGGHRFYLGDVGVGIGQLLTLGGLGIWALIDVFLIGKRLERKTEELEFSIIEEVKIHFK